MTEPESSDQISVPQWPDEQLQNMDTDSSVDELQLKRAPIQHYIDRKRRYGKEEKYIRAIETVLREYETFLYRKFGEHVCNVNDSHIAGFNEHLRSSNQYYTVTKSNSDELKHIELNDRTRHDYLRELVGFYNWLVDGEGVLSQNPAKKALNDLPDTEFDLSSPGRPHIEMAEMSEFLKWLPSPLHRAIVVFMLKTGARLGEMVNVDLSCLTLDHPLYEHLLDEWGITLHSEIESYQDAVFLDGGYQSGTKIRGEVRREGSKRQRDSGTVIPIDRELKNALLEYVLTRRRAENHSRQARPLFLNLQEGGNNDRLTQQTTYGLLTRNGNVTGALYEYGWWNRGQSTDEKVTPHYFRHYFTHNHRHNQGVHRGHMPEGVIAYVRGDVPNGDSVRERTYRHDDWNVWDRYVKRPYLNGVYQFGLYS